MGKRLSIQEIRKERAVLITGLSVYTAFLVILLLFTPYTNNLDEIKVTLLYLLGPLLIVLYLYFEGQNLLPVIPRLLLFLLVGYLFIMAISTLQSKYSYVGLFVMGYHWSLLGFYLCFFAAHRTPESIINSLFYITMFVLFTTLFGLIHYVGFFKFTYYYLWGDPKIFQPVDHFQQLIFTFMQNTDMLSTILNRDFYASFLVMFTPVAISAVMLSKNSTRLSLSIISLVLTLVCIYLAFSKDSIAALVLSLVLYFLLYKRYSHLGKFEIPFLKIWAIGFLVIFLTLFFYTWGSISSKITAFSLSFKNRDIIWGGSLGIFSKYPILGGGPGTFRIYFPFFRDPNHFLYEISSVTLFSHNRYLDILCETGILGFIFYISFMGILFFKAFEQIRKCDDERLRISQIAFFSGISGMLFTNFFSPNVSWSVDGVSFWSILGLSTACYAIWQTKPASIKPPIENFFKSLILVFSIATGILLLYKMYNLTIVKKTFDLSVLLCVSCFILSILLAMGLIQIIKNKSNLMLLKNTLLIFSILIALISSVFSIRYFISAYWHSEGLVHISYNRYNEAIFCFNKAIEYNPSFVTSYYKIAHCYHATDRIEKSLETYEQLMKYNPDYSEIHYNLGVIYSELTKTKMDEGDVEKAIKFAKKSVSEYEIAGKQANKSVVQSALAVSYLRAYEVMMQFNQEPELAKNYRRLAAQTLQRMIEFPTPPKDNKYYEETVETKTKFEPLLAQILFSLKDYEKAEKIYLKLWKATPNNYDYLVHIFECQTQQNKNREESYVLLKDALKYNPLDTKIHLILAKLYIEDKKFDEAARHVNIALKIEPNNTNAKGLLSLIQTQNNTNKVKKS